jgi:plastocyanin
MTRPSMIGIGLLALALGLGCETLEAGDLVGLVKVSNAPAPEKDRKRYPVEKQGGDEVSGNHPVQDVIIYLEGAKAGKGKRPKASMAQETKQFKPRVLPVKLGTTVEFPNLDPFYHNVFSYSKLKKFDLGRYPTGQSKSITFDQAGVVKVFCEIHSQMKGYIVVLDTDAFCIPDESGKIKISGIPNGTYNMVAWHPSYDPKVKKVSISDKPTEVEIEF